MAKTINHFWIKKAIVDVLLGSQDVSEASAEKNNKLQNNTLSKI